LVVCNLYPFEQTVAKPGVTEAEVIENIDIGGPCMVRAAAKNFEAVAVVMEPVDYKYVLAMMTANNGMLSLESRRILAGLAFNKIAGYDSAIRSYFGSLAASERSERSETLPRSTNLWMIKRDDLRYGENPHQKAGFYIEPGDRKRACVATAEQLHGKELSYNNILDLDSALNLVREFPGPAAVVVKHNNPCGAACASTLPEAFTGAWEGDSLSAFGGILAFNRPVDSATADALATGQRFVECIIAPDFESEAFTILTTKPTWKKNVRLLKTGPLAGQPQGLDYRRVDGGLLVQTRDVGADNPDQWKVVTKKKPSEEEFHALWFAWLVCKHVKSNAIVLAKRMQVVGVGAGQMSRVDSVQIAIRKAQERARGSVLASDAFFPFRDNVDTAAAAGVTAIVQPGGSQRDAESIAACDEHGLAMVFTGVRHFRH
jgi:phosphoribosylaminoimidazolecarboxamide formyltransferase/IMP cyclohydrolase